MSENLSSFFLKSGSLEAFVCIYDTFFFLNRVVISWFYLFCVFTEIFYCMLPPFVRHLNATTSMGVSYR